MALPPAAHPALIALSREFTPPRVLTPLPGVHVALGFDLANCVWLDGPNGSVVVDTLGSVEAAHDARQALQKVSTQPVQAIVYTHNHTDHVMGATAFADGTPLPVIAHERLPDRVRQLVTVVRPILYRRSMRQFGVYLPPDWQVNAGIGPRLRSSAHSTWGYLEPTHTVHERQALTLAGIPLELIPAPGETDDTLMVWLPEQGCLISADNLYKAFPNLYAIRGTPYRDVRHWVASLDIIRRLRPEVLIPMHGRPIHGAVRILDIVTCYRDAIQYVHDQTVRLMNHGLTPDEIVAQIRLPDALATHPYLQPHYGTVAWSVRAIVQGYLGWFDGQPANLDPFPPDELARRLADLAGGVAALKAHAFQAAERGDWQWALTLTGHLLRLQPGDSEVIALHRQALQALAAGHPSANGRNYLLTVLRESEGHPIPPLRLTPEALNRIAIEDFFRWMQVRLRGDRAAGLEMKIGFHFTDSDKHFTLHLRHGVLDILPSAQTDTIAHLETTEADWKALATGARPPWQALRSLRLRGSLPQLIRFLRLFER